MKAYAVDLILFVVKCKVTKLTLKVQTVILLKTVHSRPPAGTSSLNPIENAQTAAPVSHLPNFHPFALRGNTIHARVAK